MELHYTLTEAQYRESVPFEKALNAKSSAGLMGMLLVMSFSIWRQSQGSLFFRGAAIFLILLFVMVFILRARITSDKGIESFINRTMNKPSFAENHLGPHTLIIENGIVTRTSGTTKCKFPGKKCKLVERDGSLSYLVSDAFVVASIPNHVLDANDTRDTLVSLVAGKTTS